MLNLVFHNDLSLHTHTLSIFNELMDQSRSPSAVLCCGCFPVLCARVHACVESEKVKESTQDTQKL